MVDDMRQDRWNSLAIAGAIFVALAVPAGSAIGQSQRGVDANLVLDSAAFLAAHPDLLNRHRGMAAYERGDMEEALGWFRRAARYADKASQAMIGEILWSGEGVERDPALAYAWMDLAAERGYPGFTLVRERYWQALDASQREDAVARGAALYAEYGDAAAQPRIAAVLRRERRRATGSRVGYVGALRVHLPGADGQWVSIDGSRFYDRKFWDPELYQAWHDAVWTLPPEGRVDIGDVEPLRRGD